MTWSAGCVIMCCLFLAGNAQQAWLPVVGKAPEVPALVSPIWLQPGMAKATQLKASLQFAYQRDNKAAESLRERREYDPQGRLVSVYRFADDGKVAEKAACDYHGDSQQAASISVERYDAQMELSQSSLHTFLASGALASYESESQANGFTRLENTYDAAGHLIKTQHYERDRLPGKAEHYRYDAQGHLLELTENDVAGEVARVTRYTYDAQGRLSEAQVLEKGKALRYSVRYSYDEAGRLLRMERIGREGVVSEQETYKYNTSGQRTQISSLPPGETKPMLTSLSYDSKGRLKEEKVLDTDGSLFQWHRYRYDSTGTGAGEEHLDGAGKATMQKMEKFDGQGRILESLLFYQDGSGDAQVIYRWDTRGTILDEKHYQFGQEVDVFWYVHEYY